MPNFSGNNADQVTSSKYGAMNVYQFYTDREVKVSPILYMEEAHNFLASLSTDEIQGIASTINDWGQKLTTMHSNITTVMAMDEPDIFNTLPQGGDKLKPFIKRYIKQQKSKLLPVEVKTGIINDSPYPMVLLASDTLDDTLVLKNSGTLVNVGEEVTFKLWNLGAHAVKLNLHTLIGRGYFLKEVK